MDELELEACPDCGGGAVLEYEEGWCVWAECTNCGTHTAFLTYENEQGLRRAERGSAELWNARKVIHARPGE